MALAAAVLVAFVLIGVYLYRRQTRLMAEVPLDHKIKAEELSRMPVVGRPGDQPPHVRGSDAPPAVEQAE
jgi:hypothetical protein